MRHSVRARFLLTLACALPALALPAAASAGSSPVHIDPGSPVAKEYALPLASARGAPPESGKSGGLFGSGIKHGTGSTTTTAVTPTPETEPSPPPATVTATTQTQATPPPVHRQPPHVTTVTLPALTAPAPARTRPVIATAAPAAYKVLRPGSGSGVLWMVVAAIVVVALGSAGGVALSRRR